MINTHLYFTHSFSDLSRSHFFFNVHEAIIVTEYQSSLFNISYTFKQIRRTKVFTFHTWSNPGSVSGFVDECYDNLFSIIFILAPTLHVCFTCAYNKPSLKLETCYSLKRRLHQTSSKSWKVTKCHNVYSSSPFLCIHLILIFFLGL